MGDEVWKSVVGIPGYDVSSLGRMRSWLRLRNPWEPRALKLFVEKNGYVRTTLYTTSGKRKVSVHRLVAEAFLGPAPDGKPHVDHMNGDRADNRLENLRWVDTAENQIGRAERAGTRVSMECPHCGGSVSLSRRNQAFPTRTLALVAS